MVEEKIRAGQVGGYIGIATGRRIKKAQTERFGHVNNTGA